MRIIALALISIVIFSCKKTDFADVKSIDQIPGKWKWESTCGGIDYKCTFSGKSARATIEFTVDGKYIEMHNDTIYLETNYIILKYDDTFGTLELKNSTISLPVTIVDNYLIITRGELADSYHKMK
jgi:hypothetical protein